jgi:hypothetical protein
VTGPEGFAPALTIPQRPAERAMPSGPICRAASLPSPTRLAREGFTIAAPGPLQQVHADIFARKIVDRVMPGL